MKIVIIGGGNIGGAIARGLAQGSFFKPSDITVVDIQAAPLQALKTFNPEINTEMENYSSIADADMILLAVKPWLLKNVILDIKFHLDYNKQILLSVAAGITIEDMLQSLIKKSEKNTLPVLFRLVPNTAIAVKQSVTLMSSNNASSEQEALLLNIFNELGCAFLLEESKLGAGTAMTSCGIAYLFRYVRAAMQAGVELGFYPKEAQDMIVKTMQGAAALLDETKENPEVEIDRVTTPGGITIKGLNELEANGFTTAIVRAIKASSR
jgi:pyrroline-5-carboxylate reductase